MEEMSSLALTVKAKTSVEEDSCREQQFYWKRNSVQRGVNWLAKNFKQTVRADYTR